MARSIPSDDTEITLGTGKLLGLFFLLIAVCAVFFSIGYSLGKSSAKEQALNDQAAAAASQSTAVDNDKKPSAAVSPKTQQAAEDESSSNKPQNDLTFYKSVQQDQPNTQLTPSKGTLPATTTKVSAPASTAQPATVAAASETSDSPHAVAAADHGAYMVQIAAVSKQDDAAILAAALKKKSYNVFVVNNPDGTDKLFHVQVGPFASIQDAEAMKAKLMGDGYNPIVKR